MLAAHICQITNGYKLSLQYLWIYHINFVEHAVKLQQVFVAGKFYLPPGKQVQYLGGLWIDYELLLFRTSSSFMTICPIIRWSVKEPEELEDIVSDPFYSQWFITPIHRFSIEVSTLISLNYSHPTSVQFFFDVLFRFLGFKKL